MLQVGNSFSKGAQFLCALLCITLTTVFLSGCQKRPQPVVEQVVQIKEVVSSPTLIFIHKTYKAKNATNVRSAPDPDSPVVASLRANEKFTAVAKVENSDWIVVGKGNRTIGYVHQALVRPLATKKKTKKPRITHSRQKASTNLDAVKPTGNGVDLDAITDDKE